jgi:predicted RecB family nuclease
VGVQNIDGQLVLSPTDLTMHLACPHASNLDLDVVNGVLGKPHIDSDELELIFALGLAHERNFLDSLRSEGRSVDEIPTAFDAAGRVEAERQTREAMASGVDVVYQGTFFDGSWGGQADFLLRVERPSTLGGWSYEVADTKLARRMKVPALLQMAVYADRLESLQGVAPERLLVVTGDGVERPWRLVDVAAYARRARARLREFVEQRPVTEPVKVGHCAQCRWLDRCAGQWRAEDDLTLVAFMRNDHRAALRDHGITTLARLAGCTVDQLPSAIGRTARERLVQQAAEQLKERTTRHPSYLLLPPEPRSGLLRLPEPDDGDLYLDFEGDPYAEQGEGREYLAGLGDRTDGVTPIWAHSRDEERQLTIDLVDQLLAQWRQHPGMHVYHYAPYETTALKRLTARHGVREAELDQLLRGERFVDLYAVVRQGMRISKPSYSIKKLEAFYWHAERGKNEDVADALASVIAYERWLAEGGEEILASIQAYNQDDVRSTHALHEWLEARRTELESAHGPQLRPHQDPPEPDQPLSVQEVAELDLAERLRAADEPLLADLVQWHRREARPAWWEFFRLEDLLEEELEDDGSALGPLSPPELVGQAKRSRLWRYTFPPQDTRVRVGATAHDVTDHDAAGTVVDLDAAAGFVVLKRQAEPKSSRGFGPPGPIKTDVLQAAIAATGEELLRGRRGLGAALLDRRVPPATARRPGESAQGAVLRVGRGLDQEVLAVQGPPGSGKSTVGADLIRALLDEGKTVGITATSHAVIGHLLSKVGRPALQRCSADDDFCGAPGVTQAGSTAEVVAALAAGDCALVGGSAWLWAHADMAESVDVLVIDEAGQFSLANAIAAARSAHAMVLLGDPQQLAQPTQAMHPPDAAVSALEHLLDGHDTVPEDRGVFLDLSWRMHPEVTRFVSDLAYEGRLHSAPGRERQTVLAGGALSGSGLRLVTVEHTGNAARSVAEADQIARLWHDLVGQHYVAVDGVQRPLGADDVLIVAPFNNQVGELRRRLPAARVGTVDKFQGQEAPVVIYSMTSSSAEDAPRGVGFLYDLHRLNVAVSRAQAMSVLVCSPDLLDAAVHTPEQLRRVNALCRFAEMAT